MSKADLLFERGATFLEELSHKAAAEGGFVAKAAEPLAEDAAFLRKMKPTLVLARLRGEAPRNGNVASATTVQTPLVQPETMETPLPQPEPKKETPSKKKSGGGPNPVVVAAAAFVAGIFLAKVVDWRGHAHPRF
jgi:hypothetical protein